MQIKTLDLDGPFVYADHGGEGRPIVLVHGLGGSHLNWMSVAPQLAAHGRVLAPDLIGFGLTPTAGRSAAVQWQRKYLDRFLRHVADRPAVLVGNSMGGLLSILEAGERPAAVAGLVLVNPALPWLRPSAFDPLIWTFFGALLAPGIGTRYLRSRSRRLGAEGLVRQTLAAVAANPHWISRPVVDAHIELTRRRLDMEWSDPALLQATRSLLQQLVGQGVLKAAARVRARTLLVHGDRDRLIPVAAARNLVASRPGWTLKVMRGVGHVPMLEAPRRFLELITPWVDAGDPAIAV